MQIEYNEIVSRIKSLGQTSKGLDNSQHSPSESKIDNVNEIVGNSSLKTLESPLMRFSLLEHI